MVRRSALFLFALLPTLSAAPSDDDWVRREAKRVRNSDTDAWRKIPWASLTRARQASKDEGAPLFLFTMEGNLETGRC